MHSTIAIFGGSRRDGNTGKLVDAVASALGIEVVDLSEKQISPFDYEHKNRNDDFELIMRRVLISEQIILASPVYWYAASSPMKVFIDRTSDYLDLPDLLKEGQKLRGKRGYVVCTSACENVSSTFIGAFQETFEYLGVKFGGFLHVNCAGGFNLADNEEEISAFVELVRGGKEDQNPRRAHE